MRKKTRDSRKTCDKISYNQILRKERITNEIYLSLKGRREALKVVWESPQYHYLVTFLTPCSAVSVSDVS